MDIYLVFIFFIIAMLLLISSGLPIALSLGTLGILGFFIFFSPDAMMQIANIGYNLTTSETLIVIPMFLLMAQVISICKISDDFYNAIYDWLYWLPASLAACCTITSAGFAAISGSSTAATATIGSVSMPAMLRRKYNKKLICGVITSGGALGILIPPSLTFIVYGFVTETSIPKLFIAGVLPGIVIATFLVLTSIIAAKIKPSLAPKADKPTWEARWKSLPKAIPF
jgi:tripartite ATP-independent transporter DctM subunit